MTPDARRAVRTGVHTAGAMVMLGFLGWIIAKSEGGQLSLIGLGLVAILFVREMFHGAENITARLKFAAGTDGVSGEVSPPERKDP